MTVERMQYSPGWTFEADGSEYMLWEPQPNRPYYADHEWTAHRMIACTEECKADDDPSHVDGCRGGYPHAHRYGDSAVSAMTAAGFPAAVQEQFVAAVNKAAGVDG